MSTDFHLREYDALRAEVISKTEEIGRTVRFMLLANAAIVAWILTKPPGLTGDYQLIAYWMPMVISILFAWYKSNLTASVRRIGLYLKELEAKYAGDGAGWESRIRQQTVWNRLTSQSFPSTDVLLSVTVILGFVFGIAFTFGLYYPETSFEIRQTLKSMVAPLLPAWK